MGLRVYGSMLDFLRDLDVISRTDRTLVKAIDAVTNEYFNEHETEPDDEYVAKILNEDVEKVREARNVSSVVSTLRIDDQMELMGDEDTLVAIEKEDLTEKIQAVLRELDERDQLVIQLYYYEELSLKEISEILRVSEGRVSQVHKRLMQKIRDRLEGR